MRVTVTGASGNLGAYVVRELASAGHETILFDRVAPAGATDHAVVLGDLADTRACEQALVGADALVHLGGIPFASEQRPAGAHGGRAADPYADFGGRPNQPEEVADLRASVGHAIPRRCGVSEAVPDHRRLEGPDPGHQGGDLPDDLDAPPLLRDHPPDTPEVTLERDEAV